MTEELRCSPKTIKARALKTYQGQSMYQLSGFMIGCKNVFFDFPSDVSLKFEEPLILDDCPALNPGDYIVRDDEGYAAFLSPKEFEKKYDIEVNPKELHYVVTKYGFPVQDAEYMLRDEKVRAILIAPLLETSKTKRKGSGPTNITVNPFVSPTANVESIAKSISASLTNSLTNNS